MDLKPALPKKKHPGVPDRFDQRPQSAQHELSLQAVTKKEPTGDHHAKPDVQAYLSTPGEVIHKEEPAPVKTAPTAASKPQEEKRDLVPQTDMLGPDVFMAHKDPMMIDFERIAMRRAAKQASFQRKYDTKG